MSATSSNQFFFFVRAWIHQCGLLLVYLWEQHPTGTMISPDYRQTPLSVTQLHCITTGNNANGVTNEYAHIFFCMSSWRKTEPLSSPTVTGELQWISAYPARTWTVDNIIFLFIIFLFDFLFCHGLNNETCPEKSNPALPGVIAAAFILMCHSATAVDLQLHPVWVKSTFPLTASVSQSARDGGTISSLYSILFLCGFNSLKCFSLIIIKIIFLFLVLLSIIIIIYILKGPSFFNWNENSVVFFFAIFLSLKSP